MSSTPSLVLFHNPHSRAAMTRALLEELGVAHEIRTVDFRKDEQRSAEFLAINPMGKVPAILHGDAVITETVAIFIYLADRFPGAQLAPTLDEADRGPYLRWMVFYGACFEPALSDISTKREPPPRMQSPYGDFATVLATFTAQIAKGPYLLGERFSAADVMWGNALKWVTDFKLVEATPVIAAYIGRVLSRPAQQRADEADQKLAGQMGLTG